MYSMQRASLKRSDNTFILYLMKSEKKVSSNEKPNKTSVRNAYYTMIQSLDLETWITMTFCVVAKLCSGCLQPATASR